MLTIRSAACRKDLARLRAGLWGEKNLVFIRARHASSLCRSALCCDVSDIQQGTTAEGVHLGAMAGTVDLIDRVSTGIEVTGRVLRLNPKLPEHIERLDMRVRYRGHTLDLRLTRDVLTLRGRHRGAAPINLGFKDNVYEFAGGSTRVLRSAAKNMAPDLDANGIVIFTGVPGRMVRSKGNRSDYAKISFENPGHLR